MASTGSLKKMVYLHQQQYNEITVKDENTVYITPTDNYGGVIGATGATFLPVVDANGNLGWSNNGGLPNPTTRNIKGANGANGINGADGAAGINGADGANGINGADGANGINGADGAAGEKGDKGDAAFTLTLGETQTLPSNTQAYVTNTGTPQDQIWKVGIPTGENGSNGVDGSNGIDGVNGEKGAKGDAAFTVAVGTTQTLLPTQNAYVNNSGTPQDQVLNFGVPSGAKGDHGQSAFDYAEAGGYTKTEAEFQNEMAKFVYYDGSASTGVVWRGTQAQYDALTPLQKTETLLAVII